MGLTFMMKVDEMEHVSTVAPVYLHLHTFWRFWLCIHTLA